MQHRQLVALGTCLREAAAVGAAVVRHPACQQQLLSLQTWASAASRPATGQTSAAAQAFPGLRRQAAASWRSFAAEAVARPRPAPRGTSKSGSGRSLWSGLFLLAPGSLAAFLGKWQWERRQWKKELLERRQRMMLGAPVDLFAVEEEPEEYTRVLVEGSFDHAASQYVGPRTRQVGGNSQQGFLVMTPLRAAASPRCVMVNRGWVPAAWRDDPQMRSQGQPQGKVRLEGLLRRGEDPGNFVPANEPGKGAWYFISPRELAAASGLPAEAPLVEVVTEEPGGYHGQGPPTTMDVLGGRRLMPKVEEEYPLPKSMDDMLRFSVMPQDHLNYAATWWALSASTLALAVKAIRQGMRAA